MVFLCFVWQFLEGLARTAITYKEAALVLSAFLVVFHVFMVVALYFILIFSGKHKSLKSPLVSYGVPLISFVFILLAVMQFKPLYLAKSEFWNWIFVPDYGIVDILQISYLSILGAVFFVILINNYNNKIGKGKESVAALLVMVAYAIPIVVGILTQVVWPYVLGEPEIPLTSLAMTGFTVISFIAIVKYGVLDFSLSMIRNNLLDTITDGVIIVDTENRIQYSNNRTFEITGYRVDELVGRRAMEFLIKGHELGVNRSVLKYDTNTTTRTYDLCLNHKSGREIWVSVMAIPYYDSKDRIIGSIAMLKDITEKKNAELLLKKYDRTLRSLVENANEAIIVLDRDNNIVLANKGAELLFGYSFKEIVGKTISDLVPEISSEKRITELMKDSSLIDRGPVLIEKAVSKSGNEYVVELSLAQMQNEGGEQVSLIIRDITMRTRYEEKLQAINEELNTLIYRASHDLRGPVASMKGLATLYDSHESSDLDRESYFEMLKDCIIQLDNILAELTEVHFITHEELDVSNYSLLAEWKKVLGKSKKLSNYEKVTINFHCTVQEYQHGDQKLMNLILTNILSNAVVYADLRKNDPYVNVSIVDAENGIFIEVTDNGYGMDQEVQDRAYNMFYRGASDAKGAGLGLYLTRKAIQKLNGYIILSSEPGVGTTVKMYIPHPEMDIQESSMIG